MIEERGATEVLGYVLVIGLVTVLIAFVLTTGISGLESSQQAEELNNMERGFDVLSHNIESLKGGDAPRRATELRLVDWTLAYGNPIVINVTVNGELVGNQSIVSHPIEYERDERKVVYEAGAIFRSDGERNVLVNDPNFVFDTEHVLVDGMRIRPQAGSSHSVNTPGTILIRAEYLSTDVDSTQFESSDSVNISIRSERADAWGDYFSQQDVGNVSISDNHANVELNTESADITIVRTHTRTTFVD